MPPETESKPDNEQPLDPLIEAMEQHGGKLYWAVKSIARRVETNNSGEITLLFIKYTVKVGNEGLKVISKLRNLESLNLSATNITHVGLEYLKPLSKLTHLDLGENGIRDDGIIHLSAFQNLQSLTLNYNRLTDQSADWLKGFKQLKFLNLKGNLISDKKRAELMESMPYTTVNT